MTVEPHLGRDRIRRRHPVQRRLHLAPIRRRIAAARRRIVGAAQFHHLARGILHRLAAGDEVAVAQPHLAAGREAEELLRRVLHEVVALDIEFAAEGDRARAGGRVFGVVDRLQRFRAALGPVLDHQLQRPQHRHAPRRDAVQQFADRDIRTRRYSDDAVRLGDAAASHEVAQRRRRNAAPAHPGQRRHARIVPARNATLAHQPRQDALRHHDVGDVEPRELVLVRARRHRQVVDQPVVQRPVVLELQRAQRVRDALDRVRLAVRVVIGRVDAPRVAGARMFGVQDAVQHRVAQVHVGRRHVDLRAQHARAVGELARRACGGTGPGSPRSSDSGSGEFCPGSVSVPRWLRIWSGGVSST